MTHSAIKRQKSIPAIIFVTVLALLIILCSVFSFFYDIYGWAFITTDWVKDIKAKRYAKISVDAPKGSVVFFGDSLTEMYDLQEYYDFPTLNRGISGDVTSHMLDRLEDNVLVTEPSVLVLLGGANDLGHGGTPQSLSANLRQIITAVQAELPDCKIIVQSLYPVNPNVLGLSKRIVGTRTKEDILASNILIEDMCAELNVTYADVHSHITGSDGYMYKELSVEGLHLNKRGYEKVTGILSAYLQSAIERQSAGAPQSLNRVAA